MSTLEKIKTIIFTSIFSFISCNNRTDKYFGHFKKPKTLIKLKELQDKKIVDWYDLEFGIAYDVHYSVTPLDVIPFARTGSNGIHFGFLTDFNNVTNLDNAYIVSVATSYDPPVNIVAENIDEFLSMVITAESSVLLADIYKSDKDFENKKQERYSDDLYKQDRENTIELLQNEFKSIKLEQLVERVNQIRKKRDSSITIKTMDGIGIICKENSTIQEFNYSENPNEVKLFLETANKQSRIKFYRNATFRYILSKNYDDEIRNIIIDFLNKDGFLREARILKECY